MEAITSFGEVLDAADHLTLDEQESLLDILKKRLIARRRAELAKNVQEAYDEFQAGGCRVVTSDELMAEITS
ncbi:MAG: hypothetical protein AAB354_13480 [candidate division KSB1 bacterium]